MSYQINWTQGGANGRLIGGYHRVRDDDLLDIAREINLRKALAYIGPQQIISQVAPDLPVGLATLQAQVYPPFDNLRSAVLGLLSMPTGMAGGLPPTPAAVEWLWPESDADYGKVIVAGEPPAGQVSLLAKLNTPAGWTDGNLAGRYIRAVHVNELRWCLEKIRLGRWRLPMYSITGIISLMSDTGWLGGLIAKSDYGEVRAMGHAGIRVGNDGLVNVTVGPSSLQVVTDHACTVGLYQLLRDIDFADDVPTWTKWDPSAGQYWSAPGGTGAGDAISLGEVAVIANQAGTISGASLTTALQAMVDGQVANFIFTRQDTGYEPIAFSAEVVVEFELNSN
jgi:hypothetical protein